jgi:hypothetical protein
VVTGRVLSTTGAPLQGANVYLSGGAASVGTDSAGRFRLVAPAGLDTLLVRSVGFAPQRIALPQSAGDSAEPLTVRLRADQTRLSEVTVTGAAAASPREPLTQAAPRRPVPPAAGCYRVELEWAAMAARDAAARIDHTLPDLVRLTGDPVGEGWWRAESVPVAGSGAPEGRGAGVSPRWRVDGGRAVELEWPRAGGVLRLRLRVAGERLTGVADVRQDGSAVPVTLRRTSCEVR